MSARGLVPGLPSPHPLGEQLPGLYLDDDFTQRWCAGLDEVLAPVITTLDSSDAYVDPRLTPLDFLAWLAHWVGVEGDAGPAFARRGALLSEAAELLRLPDGDRRRGDPATVEARASRLRRQADEVEARVRELVRETSGLYASSGTAASIARLVELDFGVAPEVTDSGAAAASPAPGGAPPGTPAFELVVRLRVPIPEAVDVEHLDRLVARAKPAHVVHRVEVLPA